MGDTENNNLDALVRSLESPNQGDSANADQSASGSGEEAGAASVGDRQQSELIRRIGASIRVAAPPDESHLSMQQLQALVQARQSAQAEWEMPEHVSACPLCLEAFEILLEGVEEVPKETLDSFIMGEPGVSPMEVEAAIMRRQAAQKSWRIAWRVGLAAAVVIVAGIGWNFYTRSGPTSHVHSGSLELAGGGRLETGAPIPADVLIDAPEDADAATPDGSRIVIEKESRLALHRTSQGDTTIELRYGRITASVMHQEPGHHFQVTTPLGDVTVIGTKFSVTSRSQGVTVYQTQGDKTQSRRYHDNVTAVSVEVAQGVVLVRNSSEEVKVAAGKTAILHDHPPTIEVKPTVAPEAPNAPEN